MDMMWYRRRGLMVTPHIERVTGAIASFNSDYNKIPVKSLICNIDPVQEGEGDPSPENVRPISGRTGASVWKAGKNLLDRSRITFGTGGTARYCSYGSDGISGTSPTNGGLHLVPGNYTVSLSGSQSTIAESIGAYNSSGVRKGIAYNAKIMSFNVTEEDDYKLTFVIRADDFVSWDNYDIQLELGSTATDYEPYKGNTYSVNWETEAGTVYGGSLDVVSGKLVVDKRYALLSDPDEWIAYGGPTVNFAYTELFNDRLITSDSFSNLICSYIPVVSGATPTGRWLGAISKQFGLKSDDLTLEQIKSDAADGKISICYSLATPTEIQLTPQEIRTLIGENNIWCDTGYVSVGYWKWGK